MREKDLRAIVKRNGSRRCKSLKRCARLQRRVRASDDEVEINDESLINLECKHIRTHEKNTDYVRRSSKVAACPFKSH